jgi:hypothetical protein
LRRPNSRLRKQPRLQPQLEALPQQGSQQPSSQQPSAQQSSAQPHDFSQQQDGSQQSQPHPLLSIRSNRPAANPWLVRQTLTKSAPKTFLLIEPRLLYVGDTRSRLLGAAAQARGQSRICRGDRMAACGSRSEVFGAGTSRAISPGVKAGGRGGSSPRVGVDASRANPWLESVTAGVIDALFKCRSDTSSAWLATSVVSVAWRRALEKAEVIFSKWLRSTLG